MCASVGKADQLLDDIDNKQSREAVDLQLTCHPSPSLNNFAFRSGQVSRLSIDLDPNVGPLTHWVCFLFFLELLMLWPSIFV